MKPSEFIIKRAFEITNGKEATGGRPSDPYAYVQAIMDYLDQTERNA